MENLQPYLEHRSKYIKKNRSALFQKAVEECDCYMADDLADDENVIAIDYLPRQCFDIQTNTFHY